MAYRPNPTLAHQLEAAGTLVPAAKEAAGKVATAAGEVGRQVAPSYEAEVVIEGDEVRVDATTDPLSAAGWVEFGTAKLPAAAPLRLGAERAGLDFQGRR